MADSQLGVGRKFGCPFVVQVATSVAGAVVLGVSAIWASGLALLMYEVFKY